MGTMPVRKAVKRFYACFRTCGIRVEAHLVSLQKALVCPATLKKNAAFQPPCCHHAGLSLDRVHARGPHFGERCAQLFWGPRVEKADTIPAPMRAPCPCRGVGRLRELYGQHGLYALLPI